VRKSKSEKMHMKAHACNVQDMFAFGLGMNESMI